MYSPREHTENTMYSFVFLCILGVFSRENTENTKEYKRIQCILCVFSARIQCILSVFSVRIHCILIVFSARIHCILFVFFCILLYSVCRCSTTTLETMQEQTPTNFYNRAPTEHMQHVRRHRAHTPATLVYSHKNVCCQSNDPQHAVQTPNIDDFRKVFLGRLLPVPLESPPPSPRPPARPAARQPARPPPPGRGPGRPPARPPVICVLLRLRAKRPNALLRLRAKRLNDDHQLRLGVLANTPDRRPRNTKLNSA